MYLYLSEKDDFDRLPEALMVRFGRPEPVMELLLHTGRKLARADAGLVLQELAVRGFYLQMPPEIQADLYDAEA
ncbi:MAG: YcgL domain-containing protein [Gammaproteobacteria bacterium]|nr:YcgL domain-containing protein [Gammaproteobacteria bacterium]MBU1656223.1 YcgL domain-containing protein [Gammaproteobacteria bacterium]MBU1959788.1 YcgL domain-containing protein [Gammaproteobacteria bacterium]